MKILGVIGLPASGKSQVTIMGRCLFIPNIVMGDIVRAEGIDPETVDDGARDLIINQTVDKIREIKDTETVIVDGLRCRTEVQRLRDEFGDDLITIGILSSDRSRYKRTIERSRPDDAKTPEEFQKRDEREKNWGTTEILSDADIIISNTNDIKDFQRDILSVLWNIEDGKIEM